MRFERNEQRFELALSRRLRQLVKQELMATMDAIERADRDGGPCNVGR
jgi:hypothetical protein